MQEVLEKLKLMIERKMKGETPGCQRGLRIALGLIDELEFPAQSSTPVQSSQARAVIKVCRNGLSKEIMVFATQRDEPFKADDVMAWLKSVGFLYNKDSIGPTLCHLVDRRRIRRVGVGEYQRC